MIAQWIGLVKYLYGFSCLYIFSEVLVSLGDPLASLFSELCIHVQVYFWQEVHFIWETSRSFPGIPCASDVHGIAGGLIWAQVSWNNPRNQGCVRLCILWLSKRMENFWLVLISLTKSIFLQSHHFKDENL